MDTSGTETGGHFPVAAAIRAASWCLHWGPRAEHGEKKAINCKGSQISRAEGGKSRVTHVEGVSTVYDVEVERLARTEVQGENYVPGRMACHVVHCPARPLPDVALHAVRLDNFEGLHGTETGRGPESAPNNHRRRRGPEREGVTGEKGPGSRVQLAFVRSFSWTSRDRLREGG